jgi:hypothetical protein
MRILAGDAVIVTTEERDRKLHEWCQKEAVAADALVREAERTAKAWREAADGLRRAAAELKHE